jgi:hypothetical protein
MEMGQEDVLDAGLRLQRQFGTNRARIKEKAVVEEEAASITWLRCTFPIQQDVRAVTTENLNLHAIFLGEPCLGLGSP